MSRIGMLSAPPASDLLSSKSCARSMSVMAPMPSHRGHMPPVTVNVRCSVFPPFESCPMPYTDGTLKAKASDAVVEVCGVCTGGGHGRGPKVEVRRSGRRSRDAHLRRSDRSRSCRTKLERRGAWVPRRPTQGDESLAWRRSPTSPQWAALPPWPPRAPEKVP